VDHTLDPFSIFAEGMLRLLRIVLLGDAPEFALIVLPINPFRKYETSPRNHGSVGDLH
jgi:hypothetical protein